MTVTQPDRASIEAAARKFGLRIPPEDLQRGIDPVADAIEDAALRFGMQLPPRNRRQPVGGVSVPNLMWPGRTS